MQGKDIYKEIARNKKLIARDYWINQYINMNGISVE